MVINPYKLSFIFSILLFINIDKISTISQQSKSEFTFTPRFNHINSLLSVDQVLKNPPGANIKLEVKEISENILQFILREDGVIRFELPEQEPFPYHKKKVIDEISKLTLDTKYSIIYKENPFSIEVKRTSTGENLLSTNSFVYSENYAEITLKIPSSNIFGLGERTTSFKLKPGVFTMYNRDAVSDVDDGSGGHNRYGSHPMYLIREASGNYHIAYLRNSFPMDIIYSQKDDSNFLTYKTTGGVLDFSLFLGDSNPENAIKLYHNFAGGHSLPPFWAMGFHQCRWGYKDLEMIHDVLQKYKEFKLPLDTIWMDIDYMIDYVPFTVDEKRYNINDFKSYLKEYRKKFVMIAEPAMATKWPDYEYLVEGKKLDLFIKNNEGKYLINRVWPGDCYFIDYFNPNALNYWHKALDKLHEKIDFSGVWLDMNEIATFEWGQVDEYDRKISCNDDTKYPYLPAGLALERNTICPNALHYGNLTHIKLHNYLPVQQQMLTFRFLEKKFPDQYPFILTRANSVGTGKWSAHWTGDNSGNYKFYKSSITETLNSNLFGIPMSGADICGFAENTPEILCSKFYQMGSLFPFSRSHATFDSIRKEPWQMGEILLTTTQKSLKFRYQILKYYYSLFILNGGLGTIFRPLFFNFNDDMELLKDEILENQFMIGNDLLVVPNMIDDESPIHINVKAYFPKGTGAWYDLRFNSKLLVSGEYVDIAAYLKEAPPVFLRGGSTIFMNNVDKVENTFDLDNTFDILIGFDPSSKGDRIKSQGKIPAIGNYNSKNSVNDCMLNNCFIDITSFYSVANKVINVNFSKANYYSNDYSGLFISSLKIYGMNKDNNGIQIESTNIDKYIQNEFLTSDKQKYVVESEEDVVVIRIFGTLKLEKEAIQIYFNFK